MMKIIAKERLPEVLQLLAKDYNVLVPAKFGRSDPFYSL